MKRIIDQKLVSWKSSKRRKPLLVRGARQIGKTWSIEQFGHREFSRVVKIDFEKRPDLIPLFEGELSAEPLLEQLELVVGHPIRSEDCLLFFDEIQACPRAIMALRYLYEDRPELPVIAAGSLLEFALGEISIPVGRISYLEMHPMTFQEYLWATGNEPAADQIGKGPSSMSGPVHKKLLDELKRFLFIGGMPECVDVRAEGGSLLDIFSLQDDILKAYRDDFAKYGGHSDRTCLDAVMVHAAQQVGRQIQYTKLGDGFSGPTNRKAFELLCLARVLHKIPSARPEALPLGATANQKRFKSAFLDVGLMQRLCGLPVDREMQHDDLLDIYRGSLAEQFVAQELLAAHGRDLFYWSKASRGSRAEVDFLVVLDGTIHPLEVKSGKAGRLRSMHSVMASYPSCGEGLVLSSGPYGHLPEQRLRFIPLYFAGTLGKDPA